MATFLFELWKRKWLFAALAVGLLVAILPAPEGLSRQGLFVLAISIGSVVVFVTEPVPLPTVALLIAVLQVVLGIAEPKVVAKSFMSDSVFFIMGSLMIAVAFVKQKLDRRIAYMLLRVTGGSSYRFATGVMITGAFMASLIGEHTVAAILLPVCLVVIRGVSEREGVDRALVALLLFSLAFGSTIAGVGTPSGGARNAIMIQYWQDLVPMLAPGQQPITISYFEWTAVAYPMLLLCVPVIGLILRYTFKPRIRSLAQVTAKLREEMREAGSLEVRDWMTISIFGLILVLWLFFSGSLGLGTTALIGAILYLVTGLVEWSDLNSGVNWGVVLLYAAAMSIGAAMVRTGAAEWVAQAFMGLMSSIGLGGGVALLVAVSVLITLVTNTMSSGAAVAVLAPITLKIALIAGIDLVTMGFVTAIASAFGFLSVASHPGVTIVYSAGYLPATDFLRHGWKIALACILMLALYSVTYLPWISQFFSATGGIR